MSTGGADGVRVVPLEGDEMMEKNQPTITPI